MSICHKAFVEDNFKIATTIRGQFAGVKMQRKNHILNAIFVRFFQLYYELVNENTMDGFKML